MFKHLLLTALAISVSTAVPVPVLAQDPGKIELHSHERKPSKYPVYFVTDRQIKETPHGTVYSSERSAQLTYGVFQAQDFSNDDINPQDIKLMKSDGDFKEALQKTGAKHVAVFVHGYRKSFEGSLQFAEKIASELDQPVVLFAWPSKNKYSAYMIDECTAEWSSYQLADLLRNLSSDFGSANVSMISHSLGARIVAWSLRILATNHQLDKPFGCNLMFSPDVDRDTFLAEGPFLKQSAACVKVYLDKHDTRIWMSKMLHGSPRVGTNDSSADNEVLSSLFQFNMSMPSHHIPYPMLSAALANKVDGIVMGN
jgi:esterase/lipase superfamily enzyme